MNWIDFLVYSPISIWALTCSIIFSTVMLVWMARRVIVGQNKIIDGMIKDNGKVHEATAELRKDTIRLQESIHEVHKSIGAWLEMMKKIYFWIPHEDNK